MGSQLIARTVAAALFAVGLWCFAQGAIFSTSHVAGAGSVAANIWSTTAAPTAVGVQGQNQTYVAKWISATNTPPGGNTHVTFTLKAATSFLLSGMYFGGAQTLASQCSGTLRAWNFAAAPTIVLTQTTIGTSGFTTNQISIPSWPGTPFIVSIDGANGQQGPPTLAPNSTNTTPSGAPSNFVSYNLGKGASPGEAATQCKSAGYTTTANTLRAVIGITSLP